MDKDCCVIPVEVRIEQCCIAFIESLVCAKSKSQNIFINLPSNKDQKESEQSEYFIYLSRAKANRFAFTIRALSQIYHLRCSQTFATKRDLFYEQKSLYGTQKNLDVSITNVCKLIRANRSSCNVLSCGRGILVGSLTIIDGLQILDCSSSPIVIGGFVDKASLKCSAQFVLVVEKDAIFQKLINEGFMSMFSRALLVTGKGYPDIATRKLLHRLVTEYGIPIFGLMDSDPHGIEIAMTYKYGGAKSSTEAGTVSLSTFEWIGLSRTEIDRYPISNEHFLPLHKRETKKLSKLCERAVHYEDWTLLRELNCLRATGTKLELEAVSGIAPGYITNYVLREKLALFL